MLRVVAVLLAVVCSLWLYETVDAASSCITREQAITLIAHKADVENPVGLSKWVMWAIGDRESGLEMCWPNGRVKISPTGDHSLFQLNGGNAIYRNCRYNKFCNDMSRIDDPGVQIDIMQEYWRQHHDLCPWNPRGSYNPGCGYKGPYTGE
jgi:hypothetical protein